MSDNNSNKSKSSSTENNDFDYRTLRANLDASTSQTILERVEVNQRALIDKILARYATASAVYRELLQNSNDAGASLAEIDFTTSAAASEDNTNNKQRPDCEVVTQVVYRNNGMPFRPEDWDRLQKIAEGNPDVSKVGAFGVGAYTMFSVAEEPVIVSGNQVLVFVWKGDALYTKRAVQQNETPWTTFVLPSRDPYPLPDWNEFGEFLTSALTFTNALKTIQVSVNGVEMVKIEKTILVPPRPVQAPAATSASAVTTSQLAASATSFLWNTLTRTASNKQNTLQSSSGLFSLPLHQPDAITESLVRVSVTLQQMATASMDAQYVSASLPTRIPAELQRRMHRVTKKAAPSNCKIHVFLNYSPPTAQLLSGTSKSDTALAAARQQAQQMAQSLAPTAGQGRIFIGFRTSQTTGLAAHVAAPFVPTVEREAMDLQDATLRQFNSELLECAGMLLRLTLEHTMRNCIDAAWRSNKAERDILEAKAWNEWQMERDRRKEKSASSNPGANGSGTATDEECNADATASSSKGKIMNFARFMAKGVKKTIVNAAQTAASFIESGSSDDYFLLHPPDPRPLCAEEQQAIALMASFCPQRSTPDPTVGACLAQGFTDCLEGQAPPVLTRTGVVPGHEARMPRYGMEQFCDWHDGIAGGKVVRQVLFENAKEYHTVVAQCPSLEFNDLMKSVEHSVLTHEKAVTLINWCARYARIDNQCAAQIRSARLKELIRFHPAQEQSNSRNALGSDSGVANGPESVAKRLSDYLFFIDPDHLQNAQTLRELPLPDSVLPASIEKEIGSALKSDALFNTWFSPLPMEIWAEYISRQSCMCSGKPEDELMRIKVLVVLSHEYMRRPAQERDVAGAFFRNLLGNKRCIPFDSDQPTQFAADFPSDLYLYSAELKAFDGIGSFHKVSGTLSSAGVTDEFLLALGVRKSVSIDFLFSNLDTLSWNEDPKALVEYLRSATLSRTDVHKLSTTRYLPAASDGARMYSPSQLYLPSPDLGIFPFCKVLHWPSESIVSEQSANGKFLVKLGMNVVPSLSTVLAHLTNSSLTHEQLVAGLDFICDRLVPHGAYYTQYNALGIAEKKQYRILPCVVTNPVTSVTLTERYSPVACFSSSNCAIMGFPIIDPKLGKKVKLYGSLFQCDSEPPSAYLLNQLVHLEALAKQRQARLNQENHTAPSLDTTFGAIFRYLSDRSSDFTYSLLNGLSERSFIPTKERDEIIWHRPDEVFFQRSDQGTDSLTSDLFHVIEFSPFLAACGVKQEATTTDLLRKVMAQPNEVLRRLDGEKKYRALLRRIAADPPAILSRPSASVKQAPFLLGYTLTAMRTDDQSDENKEVGFTSEKMTYHLASAQEIFVIDNSNYGRMFPVKRAPPESDLEDFYVMLGSQYISKAVDRRFEVVGEPKTNTELTNALQERLWERGPLLVSPIVTSRPLVASAASILERKRLEVYEARNLMAVFTLGKISRRKNVGGQKNRIYVTSDLDMFDAGMAVGDLILKRCQLEDAFFISSLLEAPLDQLRARGFPVDRIMKHTEPVVVPEPAHASDEAPPFVATAAATSKVPVSHSSTAASALDRDIGSSHHEEDNSEHSTASRTSKADILCNMFPDADRDFIEAALGKDPSVEDVRALAEDMAAGKYPRSNNSVAAPEATAQSIESRPHLHEKKKKSMRKRLGHAFNGFRGSASSGLGGTARDSVSGVLKPNVNMHEETTAPVAPAVDASTQESLERMLESSVKSSARVQPNGIDFPESKLTSIPQDLDRGETCEIIPGHSLKPFQGPFGNGRTHNGIIVFSSKTHSSSAAFLEENEVSLRLFAKILEHLSVNVFGLKLDSIAIYHDPSGKSIAFNSNRSLHFNFRFFHALHFLQNKHETSECYSYWYVTQCHELSHNFVSAHNREHGFYTEAFSTKYFPKLVALLRSLNVE